MSVVQFFSFSLYLTIAAYAFEIASNSYDISLNIKHDKLWSDENNVYTVALLSWQLFHVIGFVALFAIPDSTEQEANRTGNIFHEFLTLRTPRICVHKSTTESLGLFQRPLVIQLFGVLDIKFSTIYTISSLIFTSITIMMQLDDQDSAEDIIH
ncbi:uncharacterized protein [Venturia canescens]|uniref:uncharacterized protein n=1 Tax=Venturia canescens TaxID=32260 RepID=UPI001C9BD0EA|nr:uncharacterized protein LOC122416137 [Venturia canescens]